ncbi:MAG TPA: hypothetical protein DC011_04830 [Bacteroidetes bacterium]|nr:hypothetical protein [Bacteroidota bacterium]
MKKFTFLLCAMFVLTGLAVGQSSTIRGTVTDVESGAGVPQANVFIVELLKGDATDFDGNYTINDVPYGEYTLRISSIGYVTYDQTLTVDASLEVIDVTLQPDQTSLEDVVVTGFGSTPKREITGAISSVRTQDIEGVSLQSTEALLQGRAAGVTVTTTSGNPGGAFKVNIRGNGSINAPSQPLYIVDGVQISFAQQSSNTSTTPLNSINPNDIESIEVLKDAAAAAIYGAVAANGVVLITTKKGRAGSVQIDANIERGVRNIGNDVDYITSDEYVQYMAEARAFNRGVRDVRTADLSGDIEAYQNFFLSFFGADPNSDGTQLANTNWQDFIFTEGITQKYNLSMSGGNAGTVFYISTGYEDTEGTAFGSDFTRLSLRTNVDQQIGEKVNASIALNVAQSTQFGVCQDGNFINCPPSQAMFEAPMSYPLNADGSYNTDTRFGLPFNPAVVRDEVDRNVTVGFLTGRVSLNYNPFDWMSVTGLVGVDYRNTQDEQYRSPIAAPTQGGYISYVNRNVYNLNTNLVVNAQQTFDEVHNVSGLIGVGYRRDYSQSYGTRGDGLTGNFFTVLSATAEPVSAFGINNEFRAGGYFFNAKYNYDEKYFITFTGRYDGSSRFGADNRWGFFPSISGAWRIAEEDFFNVEFVDDLKVRVGYGITGNSAIGNYASRGLFSVAGSYRGVSGITPNQLANGLLGWEQASEINVGLDYELLNGRIFGTFDVYKKQNSDLLFARPLPLDSGFGSVTENIGKVENRGFEAEFNSINVATSDFAWSTRFNFALSANEILELPDGEPISEGSQFSSLQIGEPMGLIQVPVWAGVNPADGRPMWYDINGNITYQPESSEDAIDYKDGHAEFVGGFGSTVSYKGLSVDAFFQFSFGQWAHAGTDFYFTRTPDFLMNLNTEVLDRWKSPGDMTYYPRAMTGGAVFQETENYRVTESTQGIYNTSYIRLKNLNVTYDIPTSITDLIGVRGMSVYAAGVNLFTWTAWPWFDPEVAGSTTDIFGNQIYASYPTEKSFYGGIRIQF